MLDQILELLKGAEPRAPKPEELQVAVAVLLIEAARMDNDFAPAERLAIERLLTERFQLSADATRNLMVYAETRAEESNQLYPFTRLAVERMPYEERVRLIEMLWEVAYADGVLDPEEDLLIRRIAGLVYVTDRDRVLARQRVLARKEQEKSG